MDAVPWLIALAFGLPYLAFRREMEMSLRDSLSGAAILACLVLGALLLF